MPDFMPGPQLHSHMCVLITCISIAGATLEVRSKKLAIFCGSSMADTKPVNWVCTVCTPVAKLLCSQIGSVIKWWVAPWYGTCASSLLFSLSGPLFFSMLLFSAALLLLKWFQAFGSTMQFHVLAIRGYSICACTWHTCVSIGYRPLPNRCKILVLEATRPRHTSRKASRENLRSIRTQKFESENYILYIGIYK